MSGKGTPAAACRLRHWDPDGRFWVEWYCEPPRPAQGFCVPPDGQSWAEDDTGASVRQIRRWVAAA